jgi:hypothetical protein
MGDRWPIWLNASGLLVASVIVIACLSLRLPARAEFAAVVFPPWWNAQQAMSATASAGAAVVRSGIIPTILIVQLAKHNGLERLHEAGIWLAIDPQAVGGCITQ